MMVIVGNVESQAASLLRAPTANAAELAYALSVDADWIAAGAPGASEQRGAVYVYACSGQNCASADAVLADDLQPGDGFGSALALSLDSLAIGAPGQGQGAVYVYLRQQSTWQLQQKLTAAGAIGDRFGSAVALQGNRLSVGSPGASNSAGAAYVFERNKGLWSQSAQLTAADGAAGAAFGRSVALSGDKVLIGAPQRAANAVGAFSQGAAYVFAFENGQWSEQATLLPQLAGNGALFGQALSISADRALIGAPLAGAGMGSAYVFDRTMGGWSQQAQLGAAGGIPGDRFGWSVLIQADEVLIGAPYAQFGCGAAYRFSRSGGVWAEVPSLLFPPTIGGLAGWSVARSGSRSVIGVPGFQGAASHVGGAYQNDTADSLFGGDFEAPAEAVCLGLRAE